MLICLSFAIRFRDISDFHTQARLRCRYRHGSIFGFICFSLHVLSCCGNFAFHFVYVCDFSAQEFIHLSWANVLARPTVPFFLIFSSLLFLIAIAISVYLSWIEKRASLVQSGSDKTTVIHLERANTPVCEAPGSQNESRKSPALKTADSNCRPNLYRNSVSQLFLVLHSQKRAFALTGMP